MSSLELGTNFGTNFRKAARATEKACRLNQLGGAARSSSRLLRAVGKRIVEHLARYSTKEFVIHFPMTRFLWMVAFFFWG